jgi:hypothetical protein
MSVLIKGMEMPKSCIECVTNHSFFRVLKCSELKGMKGFKKLPYEYDRHPDCPLVELPEKHGRLIDEDEYCVLQGCYKADDDCKNCVIRDCETILEREE